MFFFHRSSHHPWQGQWEDSDSKDESELSDSELDVDFVTAWLVIRCWDHNAPGTSSFVWRKRENKPRHFSFTAAHGVKVLDLDAASRPEEIFSKFLTEELLEKIVQETNRYVHQILLLVYWLLLVWKYLFKISNFLTLLNPFLCG